MRQILPLVTAIIALIASATRADQPNILLIYTDDFGFADVGCYGAKGVETPSIDSLARDGLKMTDAHCSAATCTPSRFALLTGSYAFRNKRARILPGNAGAIIRPGTPTIASLLSDAGYATGVVGKWHLGLGDGKVDWNGTIKPGPNEIGFDYHFLIPATGDRVPCVYVEQHEVVGLEADDPIEVSYGKKIGDAPTGKERPDLLKQKFSHGHNATIVNGISRIGFMTGGENARWVDEDMADVITEKAVDFIEDNKDEPFFLYFSTHDIHVPRVPHSRFVGKSTMGPRGDAIAQTDWCVGQLLETLEQNDLADSTLVIFTSDNGPVLDDGYVDQANEKLGGHDPNGPFRGGKYSLFEGGTRVPMLVRWPEKIEGPEVSDALFGQVDLAATLVAIAGAKQPKRGFPDSRVQVETLLGEDSVGRPHLIHEAGRLALRQGKWKYIPPTSTREKLGPWNNVKIAPPGFLFDLSEEIGEQKNVAGKHPEKVAEMTALLKQIQSQPDR